MRLALSPSEGRLGMWPADRLRVVIADDHPFYRSGLARQLRQSGIDVVREVPNGEAAIRAARETAPDVVVMDLNMPGLSGLEATQRLAEEAPSSRVLILTVSAQEADVAEAMLAGAMGYVLKDGPVEEVIAGIQAAAAGESRISPSIAAVLLRRVHAAADSAADLAGARLSARELEVLDLLATGTAVEEIAETLVISPATVRGHVSRILMKLQVENRVRASMCAMHKQRQSPC